MVLYDAAVIGGSVAGLQAALTLGRARRRVVLFDDGRARNRAAAHVHNYLGVEDPSPGELLAIGRRQLEEYGVDVRNSRVEDAAPDEDGLGFVVGADGDGLAVGADGDGSGRVRARTVVLATGLRDELPDVPGVYAVGTTTVPALFAIGAAGHASTAAVALHADLLEQEL